MPVGDGRFARVGVSIGAASYPQSGSTLDQMIVAADKAMYMVKARHKQKQIIDGEIVKKTTETKSHNVQVEKILDDNFIVELDETHVISSALN